MRPHLCQQCSAAIVQTGSGRRRKFCRDCRPSAPVWQQNLGECSVCRGVMRVTAKSRPPGERRCQSCRSARFAGMTPKERKRIENRASYLRRKARGDGRPPNGGHRRRARDHGVQYEPVDRLAVFERDRWMCQLCGTKVDRSLVWPDPRSASLDHLVPISVGGAHTYANTACAHLECNLRKGTRAVGEQLALI